jgi:uncharacterized protein
MHPSIAQKRGDISRICREYHIQRLEVVGSAARATDFDPAKSDADFLVEFEPQARSGLASYFAFKAALESVLHRGVDLIEAGAVRNPYLQAGLNSARELVYAA